MTRAMRNLLLSFSWFAVPFLVLLAFWIKWIRPYYVELDFSKMVSCTRMFHPPFAAFFKDSFVQNYIDWNPHLYRAFMRPGEYVFFYVCSLLFGDNYSAYLILTYLCVGATCGLTFYIAAEILELGTGLSCFLAALTFVSPAYSQANLFTNSYAEDPVAGFWIMAAVLFFLGRRYVLAWVLLAIAVWTKEPAWSLAGSMALAALFTIKGRMRHRLAAAFAYLVPLIAIIAARIYVFGRHGAIKSDESAGAIHAVDGHSGVSGASSHLGFALKLADRFARWPFGVLPASRQYEHHLLLAFRILGSVVDVFFWGVMAFLAVRLIARLASDRNILGDARAKIPGDVMAGAKDGPRQLLAGYPPAFLPLIILAFGSLIFPLRFGPEPRYGTGVYPLVFLSAGCLLAFHSPRLARLTAWSLVLSIGLFGICLRVSDATRGVRIYRASWQFAGTYIAAIKASAGHPLFIVDDIVGGENNSEAYERYFGPEFQVVRINDLDNDQDCRYLTKGGPPPIQLSVSAWRDGPRQLNIRSIVSGCTSHAFAGVPQLPAGPLERSFDGFHISYRLDPRAAPQPKDGAPVLLEATVQGAPPDSVVIAPDFANLTYVRIPVR